MKPPKKNRSKWLRIRLSEEEERRIYSYYNRTTSRALSEYCRDVLLKEPVTVLYRNQSADDFLQQILLLKNELNAIGNNFNQMVKRLHTLDYLPDIKMWAILNEASKKSFFHKMDELMEKVNLIHQLWSQK